MRVIAYMDGFNDAKRDKAIGHFSRYSWFGYILDMIGTYPYEYSKGYRDGYIK